MSARRRSLRSRIIAMTVLITTMAAGVLALAVVLALGKVVHHNVDGVLRDRFAAASATLISSGDRSLREVDARAGVALDSRVWVFDHSGRLVEGPRQAAGLEAEARSLAGATKPTTAEVSDVRFLAGPVSVAGPVSAGSVAVGTGDQLGTMVVMEPLAPYEAIRAAVLIGLGVVWAIVVLGSTGLVSWTVGTTLRPVRSMASRAEEWSERSLDSRFDTAEGNDEIAALGHTLNLLLDRVATTIKGEQRLTSELAHELRNPLTAIRGEAELAAADELCVPGVKRRLKRLIGLADQLTDTVATLISVARGPDGGDEQSCVADGVRAVLDQLPQPPASIGIRTNLTHGEIQVAAPQRLVARALSPIMENAVRHARRGLTVGLEVHERSVGVVITDDGPGIHFADPEVIFTPGTSAARGDGAGLGLPLARRIARSLGGEVWLRRASGPTTFVVDLPRA